MHNIFDTHAHYTDKRFTADRAELLQLLPERGIRYVLTCGVDLDDSRAALELSQRYRYIYAACGTHPHEALGMKAQGLKELRKLLRKEKCVALGEIGLDYHYDFSPRDVQRSVFEQQLELAAELRLPVIVHDREAHEDTLRLLQTYRPAGVVHCFSGSWEFAREILALGMHLGLGGAVTFKNAKKPVEVAKKVPVERLLLETDAPYMTPEPHRGQRCDSSHIAITAEKIAAARGLDAQALIDQCCENGKRLFGIA